MTLALLVDDQRSLRRSLALMLQSAGFETREAASGTEALRLLQKSAFDVVITDLRMDDMSGNDLLREVKAMDASLPVIVITAYGTIESAVDAMKLGAFDYLTKPFSDAEIIEKINASQALRLASSVLPPKAPGRAAHDIVAETPQMRATLIRVERIAATDISVLISGETGTGKTLIARLIHEQSPRAPHPFVSINCASLPEQLLESELFGHVRGSFTGATESRAGLFEEAHLGTIFLDEVDTLSPAMQAKLLAALQERQIRRVGSNKTRAVDIRVISASNQDLPDLIDKGAFRSDLYFRINGVRLQLAPLRERGDDLLRLLSRFLRHYARKYGRPALTLTPRAQTCILAYPFPGNVRELESFVEQMAVFAAEDGSIDMEALPEELLQAASPRSAPRVQGSQLSIADSERAAIEAALARFSHFEEAARELGISRSTLWRKMRQFNITRSYSSMR